MTRKIETPLGGSICLVGDVFGDATFPLSVVVTNHMPRDVVFPAVDGLFLRHCSNKTDSIKTVTIRDLDTLKRLVTDIEQIAELNKYSMAITIEDIDKDAKVESSKQTMEVSVIESRTATAEPIAIETKPLTSPASSKGKGKIGV